MKSGSTKRNKLNIITTLFLLPSVIIFSTFILYPVLNTVFLSFFKWKGVYGTPKTFVGLDNFIRILQSSSFWNSMKNSLFFAIGGFTVLLFVSFGLALLVTSKAMKLKRFFQTTYVLPVMLGVTAVGLMWKYILHPEFGAFNEILRIAGLGNLTKDWLATPNVNIWAIVLVNEWMFAGYNMLIFIAGLSSISDSLYEAASIDGCSGLNKIRFISIPLCRESFKIFSISCITGCLKTFDMVWAMTKGGPVHTSETPATLLYNEAFQFRNFGASSAIGVLLLLLGVGLSIMVNKKFKAESLY